MRRILIVDDDAAQRYLFSLLLTRMGYDFISAENGEHALELLAGGEQVDLILTDINMPGMGGEQFVKELRAFYPRIPVVVMTVRSDKDITPDTFKHSTATYLPKPFDREQLKDAIHRAFNSSSANHA